MVPTTFCEKHKIKCINMLYSFPIFIVSLYFCYKPFYFCNYFIANVIIGCIVVHLKKICNLCPYRWPFRVTHSKFLLRHHWHHKLIFRDFGKKFKNVTFNPKYSSLHIIFFKGKFQIREVEKIRSISFISLAVNTNYLLIIVLGITNYGIIYV